MHDKTRENFDRWFAGSKAVSQAGDPLVVYHGTSRKFDAFDEAHCGKNFAPSRSGAFYFMNDKEYAARYADVVSKFKMSGKPRVIEVYLSLRNPKEMDAGAQDPNDFIDTNSALFYSARDAGHDGLIVSSTSGLKTLIAFHPDQIRRVTKAGDFIVDYRASNARRAITFIANTQKKVTPHA